MLSNTPNVNRNLWKLKAPLKIKIFLWYLRKGIILTKDNLAKRNWQGSLTCASCHKEETINHLFFECHLARVVWSILQMATGINPPQNVEHMFGDWLHGYPFGTTLAFELGYPLAGGGLAFGCSGVAALGAGGHGIFFPRHMGGVLVFRLSVTSFVFVWHFFYL
ncbi:hypothetical protein U9M48_035402 [Paspalum notatum var. saurae]|uniref:Reverse transcriptase zinc-binding domain-containing protein n=1 Tax=Paspalum notatum var. saurae TaxID=547442 RepID=A0AAQ3UBK4_PASNO